MDTPSLDQALEKKDLMLDLANFLRYLLEVDLDRHPSAAEDWNHANFRSSGSNALNAAGASVRA